MTQIEQIKAEIERLKEETSIGLCEFDAGYFNGIGETCNKLFSFINSLPEEPISEDLDEAANDYADKHGFRVPYDGTNNFYDDVDVKASKEGFIAGANWQKEQMLKEAIKTSIVDSEKGFNPTIRVEVSPEKYTWGDKVKIIVIKE